MKRIITLLILAGLAPAAKAQVDFDLGIDVRAAIEQAASSEVKLPEARMQMNMGYSRGCETVTFSAPGGEAVSRRLRLSSTEQLQVCQPVGGTTLPNGGFVPGGLQCHNMPGMTWQREAQVKIGTRTLLPWESESFEVCLEGKRLDIRAVKASYRYDVSGPGKDGVFGLSPLGRVASAPDKDGLRAANFVFDKGSGKFRFVVTDRWAAEYAGERTEIYVEMYRDVAGWIDPFKGHKTFSFDPARDYVMEFGFEDLEMPALPPGVAPGNNGYPSGNPGYQLMPKGAERLGYKDYYLKWGFRRVGKLSTGERVDKGETSCAYTD